MRRKSLLLAAMCLSVTMGSMPVYATESTSAQVQSESSSKETSIETTNPETTPEQTTTIPETTPEQTTTTPETTPEPTTKKPEPATTKKQEPATTKKQEPTTTKKAEKETTKKAEKETTKKAEKETTKKTEEKTTKKSEKKASKKSKDKNKKSSVPGKCTSISVDSSTSGTVIAWGKAKNATHYILYRNNVKLTDTTGTGFTDTGAVVGVVYTYSVVPYNKSIKGPAISKGNTTKKATGSFNYQKKQAEVGVNVIAGTGYVYPMTEWHPISASFYETTYHTTPHNGTDIAAPKGTPIMAMTDGEVEIADYTNARGNEVVIEHSTDNYWSRYQHMDAVYVKAGEIVKKGQIIGTVGSTGNSTGPHLHLELGMNSNYNSVTSYLDGGALLDAMLYLPANASELAAQIGGTYVNPYFKDGKAQSTASILKKVKSSMKKEKTKALAKKPKKKIKNTDGVIDSGKKETIKAPDSSVEDYHTDYSNTIVLSDETVMAVYKVNNSFRQPDIYATFGPITEAGEGANEYTPQNANTPLSTYTMTKTNIQ